jgi:hypothetical protein
MFLSPGRGRLGEGAYRAGVSERGRGMPWFPRVAL